MNDKEIFEKNSLTLYGLYGESYSCLKEENFLIAIKERDAQLKANPVENLVMLNFADILLDFIKKYGENKYNNGYYFEGSDAKNEAGLRADYFLEKIEKILTDSKISA